MQRLSLGGAVPVPPASAHRAATAAAWLVVAGLALGNVLAERLPVTPFGSRDGLHSDGITRIVRDRDGRLWFGHRTGLSRLDGRRFETYGPANGLPRARVRDMLAASDGTLLVATAAGFFRLDPHAAASALFTRVGAAVDAFSLAEDAAGTTWGGTAVGLCRFGGAAAARACVPVPLAADGPVVRVVRDGGDGLLLAAASGLLRRAPDGTTRLILPGEGGITTACVTSRATWIGSTTGLARITPPGAAAAVGLAPDGDPRVRVFDLLDDGDGAIWVASSHGLWRIEPGDPPVVRRYTAANGLAQNETTALGRDAEGNLWVGTESAGVMRIARGGFESWDDEDGLADPRIASLFATRDGTVHATAGTWVFRHEGARFTGVRLGLDPQLTGWGWSQWTFEDRAGEWWIPSRLGVLRTRVRDLTELPRTRPASTLLAELHALGGSVFRLFENREGDVWIGTIGNGPRDRVFVWRRHEERLERLGLAQGLPQVAPTAFENDASGAMWIGFYTGGVGRWRDGHFEFFPPGEEVPPGLVRALHADRAGRLWIATESGGVSYVDDPAATHPAFARLTVADGLSSDLVATIVEDDRGRLYFGTDRGIDRYDPRTRRIHHYGIADGLPNAFVNAALRDRTGALWFGTLHGIARLVPGDDEPPPVPAALIRRIRVAGAAWPVSELGEPEPRSAVFGRGADHVTVEYGALAPARDAVRFQYRLDGAMHAWSEPSPQDRVEFAALAPGTYRFEVRAVDEVGRAAERTASFVFTVRAPFWRTGWFAAIVAGALAAAGYGVHRMRLQRAVDLERIRTRIASDLHDDIGATLSKMAILLDALQRRERPVDDALHASLGRLAESAREAVDSMSDIVWAINPRRDRLGDLAQRMRRFASDAFEAREIEFTFDDPEGSALRVGPDVRRDLLLLFKESINNALRHAQCTRVEAALEQRGGRLILRVHDDGRGFDPANVAAGNGLASMQRRVEARGGILRIEARPGDGATITVEIPLVR